MAKTEDPELAAIALEIRQYLEGRSLDFDHIVEWWFKQRWYEEERARVHGALEYLVARGELTKRVPPGGRILYAATGRSTSAPNRFASSGCEYGQPKTLKVRGRRSD